MTIAEPQPPSELEAAINRYESALRVIETASEKLLPEQILEIITARDAVSNALNNTTQPSAASLATIIQLDDRLKQQAESISKVTDFAQWRASFHPPDTAWWWQLEEVRPPLKPFDKVWEMLSMIFLVITSSFLASIHPRFAAGGVGIMEAFGMISQSGLTLLVAGGSFTQAGQVMIESLLKTLKIPKHYQPEFSCGLSTLMLLSAIALNASLPTLANYYYQDGKKSLHSGQLQDAQDNIDQAIALNPQVSEFYLTRGEIYEAMLKFDEAQTAYQMALAGKNFTAFNNLGRLSFLKKNFVVAETLFRMGLDNSNNDQVRYKLYKNLGWTLLKEKRYPEAKDNTQKAIELTKKLPPDQREGLAHCIMFEILEASKGDPASLKAEKKECLENSQKFGSLREYDWYTHIIQRYQTLEGVNSSAPQSDH